MAVMTGAQAVIEILRRERVEYVFGLPGTSELEFLDILEDSPDIKYILGLHESVPMAMAENYSRVSGKVGLVNLHTLAGLSASMAMFLNSHMAGAPLLITAGNQDARMGVQESDMSGDLVRMASQFSKWSTEVTRPEDLPLVFRRAFKVATQPPTGPVFIALPMNVMSGSFDFEYVPNGPVPAPQPDGQAMAAAVELLAGAKNPVILVGQGIHKAVALEDVVKLAELTGARVYQRWMGDVNFPTSHPQYLGDLRITHPGLREDIGSADVLAVIGENLLPQPFYQEEPPVSRETQIIHIHDNPWEVGKNFPVTCGIVGNIKTALVGLNKGLESAVTQKLREVVAKRAAAVALETRKRRQAFLEQARRERENVPISITRLMHEIKDALKPGTMLVDDSISARFVLRQAIPFNERFSYISDRGVGIIGWGMAGAVGVKLAAPDRPVVAVCGDGGAMWCHQAMWTAVHYDLPVTFIIIANTSYNVLKVNKQTLMGDRSRGRYLGMDFDTPRIDFTQLAGAVGITGQRVEKPGALGAVLKAAIGSDKPNLVEVLVARSY